MILHFSIYSTKYLLKSGKVLIPLFRYEIVFGGCYFGAEIKKTIPCEKLSSLFL